MFATTTVMIRDARGVTKREKSRTEPFARLNSLCAGLAEGWGCAIAPCNDKRAECGIDRAETRGADAVNEWSGLIGVHDAIGDEHHGCRRHNVNEVRGGLAGCAVCSLCIAPLESRLASLFLCCTTYSYPFAQ